MPTSSDSRTFSFRKPAIALVAIMAVYVSYVIIQYGRLNDLNQRELAKAASELNRAIENSVLTVKNFNPATKKPETGTETYPWCTFDQNQPYLEFDSDCKEAKGKLDGLSLYTTEKAILITDTTKATRIRVLPDVLRELSFPESFQLTFIANGAGTVLQQDQPDRRQWLRWLRWSEREFRDSGADRSTELRIDNFKNALTGDKDAEWRTLQSMSGRTALRLGTDYQVYVQPITLQSGEQEASTKLVLGGAVPTFELVRKSLSMDSYFLALVAIVLLLGFLGSPFVKLIALDRRERFRMADVYLLYLSTGALLALLTFLVIGWDSYRAWYMIAEKGLDTLARSVSEKFHDEVTAIRDQLVAYDQTMKTSWPGKKCSEDVHVDWFNREDDTIARPDSSRMYLEQVTWLAPDGTQKWKITANPVGRLLEKEQITARPYYRAVKSNSLFRLDDGEPFFLTPDRSITDGKFKTFISIPSKVSCTGSDGQGYIVTAVVKLLSLDRPPLPAGYGFAIFNREGRVLYHSDSRLSLRENFFSETSVGPTMKALVAAGSNSKGIPGRYRERAHEFLVRPLGIRAASEPGEDLWYISTFRDLSEERTAVAHAFLTSLSVTLLLLAFSLLIGMAAIPAFRKRKWNQWLWPHGGLKKFHRLLAVGFLCVLVVAGLLSYVGGPLVLILVMPLAAVVTGVAICRSDDWRAKPRLKMEKNFWQCCEIILMSLCLVIIPSAALFRLILSHDFGRIVATERRWIQDQLEDIKPSLEAEERAENHPEKIGQGKAVARLAYLNACPDPFNKDVGGSDCRGPEKNPTVESGWSNGLLSMHEWLDQNLPIENDVMGRSRYQEGEPYFLPIGFIGLGGILVTSLILFWWVRWNTGGLFHAYVDAPTAGAPVTEVECRAKWSSLNTEQKLLLIQVAQYHIANPRQRKEVAKLVKDGLLKLAPDLQPGSTEFGEFVKAQNFAFQKELLESEKVTGFHSWHYARVILFVAVGGMALFLFATQPGWQTALLGIATATTGLLTAFLRVQDIVLEWIRPRKG